MLAAFVGARRPGAIRTSESWANVFVSEVAAFDGPSNRAMKPTPDEPEPARLIAKREAAEDTYALRW